MTNNKKLVEFEKLIDGIGANRDEAFKKLLMLYAKKHETFIDAITKFIKSNNTSFTHLWEDSEEGADRKFVQFAQKKRGGVAPTFSAYISISTSLFSVYTAQIESFLSSVFS